MVAKSTAFGSSELALIFNATPIANIADNASASPLTSLYLSLHTADPGIGGSQTTSEAAYTSYARAAVTRNSGGFTVSGETVTLTANINFPAATGGSETETYWAVGTSSSGTGEVLYKGPISPTIVVSTGVTPQLTTGTTITES